MNDGNCWLDCIDLTLPPSAGAEEAGTAGGVARISMANPYRAHAPIRLRPASPGEALEVLLFDAHGRRVREIFRGVPGPAGEELSWDGRDESGAAAPMGLYFLQVSGGRGDETRKFLLLN